MNRKKMIGKVFEESTVMEWEFRVNKMGRVSLVLLGYFVVVVVVVVVHPKLDIGP